MLHNKYKPTKFSDMIGNKIIFDKLQEYIDTNSIPNCLLLSGQRGTGKSSSADILADSIKRRAGVYNTNTFIRYTSNYFNDIRSIRKVRSALRKSNLPKKERMMILSLVRDDQKLNEKIERLDTMQNLFKYWHVVHFPFALVMLIIMSIHVAVTILLGYRWIF